MLNAQALSELLSTNSDERLCKRWCLVTPNGTLLAYSKPANTRSLRKMVAVVAMSWQEHQPPKDAVAPDGDATNGTTPPRELHTLIIQSDTSNILVRALQPNLLLVLEGGVPPRRRTFEPRVIAEGSDGEPLHGRTAPDNTDSALGTSTSSKAESNFSMASRSVLALHRKKLAAMASAISAEFAQTGFKMPDDNANKIF